MVKKKQIVIAEDYTILREGLRALISSSPDLEVVGEAEDGKDAIRRVENLSPDLILVDGQGIAHPRRFGLASHLGLFLDTPTIGCAKSRLCGNHQAPGTEPGSGVELVSEGKTIGMVIRTKIRTKPVYISVGHKIDLPGAVQWVLKCCRGYRLPEPIRLAHQAAGGYLKLKSGDLIPEETY